MCENCGKEVTIYYERCRPNARVPEYAHENDAGMDIRSAVKLRIEPGQTVVIPTGIRVAIPNGYEIQVRPRSGISLKTPLRVSNSPGTIDAGYRDEIGIIVTNTSNFNYGTFNLNDKGNEQGIYIIEAGDKVAQLVLQKVPKAKMIEVDTVSKIGQDRGGGFGSTGID